MAQNQIIKDDNKYISIDKVRVFSQIVSEISAYNKIYTKGSKMTGENLNLGGFSDITKPVYKKNAVSTSETKTKNADSYNSQTRQESGLPGYYNDFGNLNSKTVIGANGHKTVTHYYRDRSGIGKIETEYDADDNPVDRFERTPNGTRIQTDYQYEDGQLVNKTDWVTDPNDNLIRTVNTSGDGVVTETRYQYGPNGELLRQTDIDAAGNTTITEFEYNDETEEVIKHVTKRDVHGALIPLEEETQAALPAEGPSVAPQQKTYDYHVLVGEGFDSNFINNAKAHNYDPQDCIKLRDAGFKTWDMKIYIEHGFSADNYILLKEAGVEDYNIKSIAEHNYSPEDYIKIQNETNIGYSIDCVVEHGYTHNDLLKLEQNGILSLDKSNPMGASNIFSITNTGLSADEFIDLTQQTGVRETYELTKLFDDKPDDVTPQEWSNKIATLHKSGTGIDCIADVLTNSNLQAEMTQLTPGETKYVKIDGTIYKLSSPVDGSGTIVRSKISVSEIEDVKAGRLSLAQTTNVRENFDYINETLKGPRIDSSLENYTIQAGDSEVKIRTDNNIYTEGYEATNGVPANGVKLTNEMLEYLESGLQQMVASGQTVPEEIFITDLFKDKNADVGVFVIKNPNVIFLNVHNKNYEYMQETLFHESGHMKDFSEGNGLYLSDTKGINFSNNKQDLSNDNVKDITFTSKSGEEVMLDSESTLRLISWYSLKNQQEFVAETTTMITSGKLVKVVTEDGEYYTIANLRYDPEQEHHYRYPNAKHDNAFFDYEPDATGVSDIDRLNDIMKLYEVLTDGTNATPKVLHEDPNGMTVKRL